MIIEFVDVADDKPVIFIHFDFNKDRPGHVDNVAKYLRDNYKKHVIMRIPNGHPCPNNPLPKIAVFDQCNKSLLSAIRKVCELGGKPGSFVPLDSDEMKAVIDAQANGEIVYF